MDKIIEYLQGMENRINGRFDGIENRLDKHEDRLTALEINVENDIKKYCDTLADGHITTQRKLDEISSQIEENKQNYIISRLNLLEREMREIQAKLA